MIRDIEALRRKVEAYRRSDDERGLAVCLGELGVQLAAQAAEAGTPSPGPLSLTLPSPSRGEGVRGEVRTCLTEALGLFERVEDHAGIALTWLNLGNLASEAGEWEAALAAYRAAIPLFERLGDLPSLGLLYRNLGLLHRRMNQPAQALPAYQQAAALHERVGDDVGMATALYHLAHLHAGEGALRDAVRAMERVVVVDLAHGFPKYAENIATLRRWRAEAGLDPLT